MRVTTAILGLALLAALAQAHVGSPDIYLDGKAGPYQLFVTVRPPLVIPGVAQIEIRCQTSGVREIRAAPLPISGPGAKFAPVPDKLKASAQDPQFFTGSLWMMTSGSWEVRLTADGTQGKGVLAIPVPSAALATRKMQPGLGLMLSLLGVFLIGGVVAMAGAAVREARLRPGATPAPGAKRRGRIAMSIAFVIVIAAVWGGNTWWNSEATTYGQRVYKPLQMRATLDEAGMLTLNLSDPGWLTATRGRIALFTRRMDDLIPDHDHLMHLYAIREPGLDAVFHLHPDLAETGVFRLKLPSMPAGEYKLYADIVHSNGFPETLVATVKVPALRGRALAGDDASGFAHPWNESPGTSSVFNLPDGYRMEWLRPAALRPNEPVLFRFRLTDPSGRAPRDMALYMGMLGHAAFVKTDGSVFAHVHPEGSVSMAAFMMAQRQAGEGAPGSGMEMNMAGMNHENDAALPNEVSFPYGFPTAGRYRILVQMKHGATVETGIFDATVP